MVQSFIHARTLGPLDMRKPNLASKIAKQLRKFHQVEVPGSKEPQLWNDIFKFFKQASKLKFDDNEKCKKYETVNFKEIHVELVKLTVSFNCILSNDADFFPLFLCISQVKFYSSF